MKTNMILTVTLAAYLCACSPASPSADRGGKKAETPNQTDESKADWQLQDDSMFIATIDPWPPKAGTVKLKAEATMDDAEQKFAGTVAYRVAASKQTSEPWKPMPRAGEDKDGTIQFAVPLTLSQGTVYIQFRVRDAGDKEFTDLTDWKVSVR